MYVCFMNECCVEAHIYFVALIYVTVFATIVEFS